LYIAVGRGEVNQSWVTKSLVDKKKKFADPKRNSIVGRRRKMLIRIGTVLKLNGSGR